MILEKKFAKWRMSSVDERYDFTKKNSDQARIADRLAQFLLENEQILDRYKFSS